MKCGNTIISQSGQDLECNKYCGMTSGFVQVTEENKDSIPFPTQPYLEDYRDGQPYDTFCNDVEGVCPCGVFTAHLINKKCDLIETAVPKEPLYPHCQCKSSLSPCGHSVSHRLVDPCTGQP
jgi:hypothetical protein